MATDKELFAQHFEDAVDAAADAVAHVLSNQEIAAILRRHAADWEAAA